jgi:hypothetical protein
MHVTYTLISATHVGSCYTGIVGKMIGMHIGS